MDSPEVKVLAKASERPMPSEDSNTAARSAEISSESNPAPASSPFRSIPECTLIFFALFAFGWAVARAHLQAITGDEGDTYVMWVADSSPSHWLPSPNNHILNSILMRLSTSIFGLSPLTIRAPALLGAGLYIAVSLWFSRLFTEKWTVRLPLFVCLVYNPFVFDYFVAARGYGLATAFLLWGIAIPAWCYLKLPNTADILMWASGISSVCLALSFTANFAFAFVQAPTLVLLILGALYRADGRGLRWRVLAASIVPGLLVVLLLPSWTLLHWQPGFLFAGGTSLHELIGSVVEASTYQLNPHLANPLLYAVLKAVQPFLIPTLCGIAALQLALAAAGVRRTPDENTRKLLAVGAICFGALAICLLLHQATYWSFHLLMPKGRMALFVAPLGTLVIGAIASMPPRSRAARWGRGALLAALSVTALYFVMCLRLTHFEEWQYQEDVGRAYDVVAWYNHNRGVKDVEVSWFYYGALRFYRELSGHETLAPFSNSGNFTHPVDKQLYVLDGAFEGAFIDAQKLKVVWHGPRSDVVIAIRPELAGSR
jgi:hypothetical protein